MTLSSHLAFVAIDEAAHPRPVGGAHRPGRSGEAAVIEAAQARREARRARLASRAERAREVADETEGFRWRFEQTSVRLSGGRAARVASCSRDACSSPSTRSAAILAVRYARAPVATASMDALEFYAPIRVGDILTYRGALTRVGTRSMEVEHPGARGGAVHAATSGTPARRT